VERREDGGERLVETLEVSSILSGPLILSPLFFLLFLYRWSATSTPTPTVHRALLHTVPLHTHTRSTPHTSTTLTVRLILGVRN
jgi:hypothetical protein